jgi:transaldolase/glucose-6-phosphate isomerase
MLDKISYSLPAAIENDVRTAIEEWRADDKISRLWAKDASLWTNSDEAKWLGWLDVIERELGDLRKYRDFNREVRQFDDIVLLGMGGSSLCPEVLALTFGVDNFHVLDSTVPAQVKAVEDKVDLAKTLFIVASKSGSTLEPNCFKQYFYERVAETVGRENAGQHFVAITDPGSKMQQVAERDGFRRIFFGDPEIGGRFSALSVFGMVPAAAMQLNVKAILRRAAEMAEACKNPNPEENPGAILGIILGVCHKHNRDKLTIFTPAEFEATGAWLEQLIAESTGKNDVSIIPINGEPFQPPMYYSEDRIFVHLELITEYPDLKVLNEFEALKKTGQPFITLQIPSRKDLGQECFLWEFATAVAGSLMGINPFDQPDVESAKIEARKITDEYEKTGSLPPETPFFESDGIQLFSSEKYAAQLNSAVAGEKTLKNYFQAHILEAAEADYFATLAYVEMNEENTRLLQSLREGIFAHNLSASCLGFGPRFLHSTGQAYKGGANNGVFLQITADDKFDLPVPGQSYTFGVVKAAQSRGDFQVLLDRDRRALRVHFASGDVVDGVNKLIGLLGTERRKPER